MNITKDILQAVVIGLLVAVFLLNTGRALKAIRVCKECLSFLNNRVVKMEGEIFNLLYISIYRIIFKAYCLIPDHTEALIYGRKLLNIYRQCRKKGEETNLTILLANLYRKQYMYLEAMELYETAINIAKEVGDRENTAYANNMLGTISCHLGDYDKAKENLENALAIRIQIGDKKGEASSYGNLGTLFLSLRQYDKAKEYLEKALAIRIQIGDKDGEASSYGNLGTVFQSLGQYGKAKEYLDKALAMRIQIGDKKGEAADYGNLGTVFHSLGQYDNAKEYLEKALAIRIKIGDKTGEASSYGNLGTVFQSLGQYGKAKEYLEKAIAIRIQIGDKGGEAADYGNLGTMFTSLGQCDKAKEYLEKALAIRIQIGDKKGEASSYGNLGTVFKSLGQYDKAKEYLEKAHAIRKQIGDKEGEAADYGNLGTVFQSLGQYDKAKEHLEKALAIEIQIGDKEGEASSYGNLGNVFQYLGQYNKAKEHLEKALTIKIQTGDKNGEASSYGNLGTVFQSLGQYDKAKEYLEKALAIRIQIGDKRGEAADYGNLGTVFQSLGQYDNAKEYLEKALAIRIQIGDKDGEASTCGNLGTVFKSLGHYDKAKEYLEKALAIRKQIGDKKGEAADYGNLGTVFQSLGQYDKAKEYHEKALTIEIQIGDKRGEASSYGNLGNVFQSLGQCDEAKEHLEKALAIKIQIGDKNGEASLYGNLGNVFQSLGQYDKAKEYLEKALAIRIQIGDKRGEAADYGNLAVLCQSVGEFVAAEDFGEMALSIARDIKELTKEFEILCLLTIVKICQHKVQEAFDCMFLSLKKSESLRSFLRNNDDFKVSSSDVREFPYQSLSAFFCILANPNDGLYVLELARARALADLMSSQYSVEGQISADPQSWTGIENIMKKESNSSCLYISYHAHELFFWILKTSGIIHFRRITVDEKVVGAGLVANLDDFFAKCIRSLGILSDQECEDRSLNDVESLAALRLIEVDDEESQNSEWDLSMYYRILISPVADLLEEPEIIVVPDRALNQVPFPALTDERGRYLSETFRIRIVPSLTTLKLIQDSPAEYHSQTGALIVGDPDVATVYYKGKAMSFSRLPFAEKEAVMIGEHLGVQPLLGEHATKQVVLERLHSVSLIHFAAHGNAERGEIALSPVRPCNRIPEEEDYLLTMSDIAQVQLRAKLVVLSCCHSGRGQIRAEGVIGIARAFLGSGARSVLVALWAIRDDATEQLMCRFYEHLVRGESASESLHQAMKWMRSNGFKMVSDWAPFMLIGDNVAFEFGK